MLWYSKVFVRGDFCWLKVRVIGNARGLRLVISVNYHLNNSFDVFFWGTFSVSSTVWLQGKNDNLVTVICMKWIVYLQLNPALVCSPVASPQSQFQYAGSTSALMWTFHLQVFIEVSFPFEHRPTGSKGIKWNRGGGDSGEAVSYYVWLWIIYLSLWLCRSLRNPVLL